MLVLLGLAAVLFVGVVALAALVLRWPNWDPIGLSLADSATAFFVSAIAGVAITWLSGSFVLIPFSGDMLTQLIASFFLSLLIENSVIGIVRKRTYPEALRAFAGVNAASHALLYIAVSILP